jgi:hypothetical protein
MAANRMRLNAYDKEYDIRFMRPGDLERLGACLEERAHLVSLILPSKESPETFRMARESHNPFLSSKEEFNLQASQSSLSSHLTELGRCLEASLWNCPSLSTSSRGS